MNVIHLNRRGKLRPSQIDTECQLADHIGFVYSYISTASPIITGGVMAKVIVHFKTGKKVTYKVPHLGRAQICWSGRGKDFVFMTTKGTTSIPTRNISHVDFEK